MRRPILAAAIVAAATLLSGAARAGDIYISAQLDLLPAGRLDAGGERLDLEESAGFGATFEWAALDFLSVGLTARVRSIRPMPVGEDALTELQVDPVLRLFYPGEHIEPYVRGRIGGAFGWPPDAVEEAGLGSGAGWNWGVGGGLLARIWILGVFAEAGYGWSRPTGDFESRAFELGLGLALIF